MRQGFKAGVARCDITPPVGIAHGTWSAQVHERAEGIDLPLWCTALAVTDGVNEVIIAEWDLVYPPDGEWLVQARKRITELTGVPGNHVRISASHTHSGPSVVSLKYLYRYSGNCYDLPHAEHKPADPVATH